MCGQTDIWKKTGEVDITRSPRSVRRRDQIDAQLLAKALKSVPQMRTKPLQHGNVYVTVNVVDDKQSACVVKGTVIVSKGSTKSPHLAKARGL